MKDTRFYPNVSQESYAQNFSSFFDWYCLNNKDNVLEIKNFDEIMEIYDELIKLTSKKRGFCNIAIAP